ncbi:hypothetical protein BJ742DRAFT_819298 [Cladochytrium replicatum]|nr:hypothetical protein BJ742DRAFT_819298 [Cladochytrium replicatum]
MKKCCSGFSQKSWSAEHETRSMKNAFTLNSQLLGNSSIQFQWQKRKSTYLAVAGSSRTLFILDHKGDQFDTIPLQSECAALDWDPSGDSLACIQEKSSSLILWDIPSGKSKSAWITVECGMKALNLVVWNPTGEHLAVATGKGNLLLYTRSTQKKIPILGKHTKAIVTAAWTSTGSTKAGEATQLLACASDDRTFTLTNLDGDTVFQMALKGDPNSIQWSPNQTVMGMVLSNKTLFFHDTQAQDAPIELAFQSRYGAIVAYHWFNDGLVMIGFASGYFVVISTNLNEIGQEMFQSKDFKDSLCDISVSMAMNRAAIMGDNCVKVHDLNDLKDVTDVITLEDERGTLERVEWSPDGQFLTIATKRGSLYTYLSRIPILGSVNGANVAYLTSLTEVTIADQSNASSLGSATFYPTVLLRKQLDFEPSLLSLGPYHLAVGNHNALWFFTTGQSRPRLGFPGANREGVHPGTLVLHKEYNAAIKAISLSDRFAAVVLVDGKLAFHSIENMPDASGEMQIFQKVFPVSTVAARSIIKGASDSALNLLNDDTDPNAPQITCAALTSELLVYGTSNGGIHHYSIEDLVLVNEMRHSVGIAYLHQHPKGAARLIFRDTKNDGFLFSPTADFIMPVPSLSAKTKGVTWERNSKIQRNVFVSWDDAFISVSVFNDHTMKGAQCLTLGTTKLPYGLKPLLLHNGVLTCQTSTGKLSIVNLSTHEIEKDLPNLPEQDQGKYLQLLYTIGKIPDLWACAKNVTSKTAWKMVADAALHVLDVTTAKLVYRQVLHDAGMVMTLTEIEHIEDKNLLRGHIAVLFGDYKAAQDFFLDSSGPICALELRRDLMQWDQALTLAATLAPNQTTVIAREYAKQLELNGKYAEALAMYEKALATAQDPMEEDDYDDDGLCDEEALSEHQIACSAGLTRMTLRLGDVSRGMKMLGETTDRGILSECATILEGIKQFSEAGKLFERAQQWEKAAEVYIKAKSWPKVAALLPNLTSPRIFGQYAKAMEAQGSYKEAAQAYEKARDFDNVVRLYVEHLQNVEGAVAIVRSTRSRDAAKMVSKFFQMIKDYKSVVEFCLVAGMQDEAFELAQQHDVMEHYAELIKEEATPEMLMNVANFFQNANRPLLAGKYLMQAGNYARALKLFLDIPSSTSSNSSSSPTALDLAIETVGLAKSDALTHELIDYLMGERDGVPKPAKYIFKLYVSLQSYKEAARTAAIIAKEEQASGNYKAAKELVLGSIRELRKRKVKIPSEVDRILMLLHSYMLVKVLIKADEHMNAARLLIRVAHHISQFPSHVVPILTTTVLECHRAGLHRSSFEHAATLMRPEYRGAVDVKFKRKIEQIVRRPEAIEPEEEQTPCPICGTLLGEMALDCKECKNHLQYCIATGKHMTRSEWSHCPSCLFPGLTAPLQSLVEKTRQCPMCGIELGVESIVKVDDPSGILNGINGEEEDQLNQYVKNPKGEKVEEKPMEGKGPVEKSSSPARMGGLAA